MKISIVTACYNSVPVLRTALECVLAQTWPEVEYLVIDGGSADCTAEILRETEPKFGGRMRWLSERDGGVYEALNIRANGLYSSGIMQLGKYLFKIPKLVFKEGY